MGALDVAFAFARKARDHDLLRRRFTELLQDVSAAKDPGETDFVKWHKARLDIESDEPPIYWAVEASCHNDLAVAWDLSELAVNRLSAWQRLMQQWLAFQPGDIVSNLKSRPPGDGDTGQAS